MSAKTKSGSRLDELALEPLALRAWRRGVLGGERAWLVVGAVVWLLRRVHRRAEEVVYTESLGKGQTLQISHQPPPPTRRARRKARRRARRRAERAAEAERAAQARAERASLARAAQAELAQQAAAARAERAQRAAAARAEQVERAALKRDEQARQLALKRAEQARRVALKRAERKQAVPKRVGRASSPERAPVLADSE